MKSRLLLDVVVTQCPSVLKLFACEDKSLLVGRNTFFVLDLSLYVINRVGRLNLECDRLASQSLHEDLHTTAESQDQVKR